MQPQTVVLAHVPFKQTRVFLNINLFLLNEYENGNHVYQVSCAGTEIEL